jgi:hypothetical protein
MKTKQISKAEMQKRVAHFKELRPSKQAFVDSLIPGHEREIFNVIGHGVTEDAYLLAVLGGTDAGRVVWSPDVLEKAKQTGLTLDRKGNLITSRA